MNATKLRDLDASEEFFWLIEQSVSVFHTVVAEVTGATTIQQWKDALDAVQIRHPLLTASIRKVAGKRPFFEKVHGASVPLRIISLTNSLVLEEAMEKELLEPSFGDGSGPLTRATLLHSAGRSVVLFSTHHSSLDGKSHLFLVQDLLASVAGEKLGEPLEVQPGIGQLLGLPEPAEYTERLEGKSVAPEDGTRIDGLKPRVRRVQLDVEETRRLLVRAREEGTTVHAVLVAALALAGKRHSRKWSTGPIRCMTSIDMRKALQIPDAVGLLISGHAVEVATPAGVSIWEIARSIWANLLPAQSIAGARPLLLGLSFFVAREHNARDMYWAYINGPMVNELIVTNYAGYRVRTEYGRLKIQNLFTGSPPAVSTQQKVSVLTVDGRLGMTLVARGIFPTLLEDTRDLLTHV